MKIPEKHRQRNGPMVNTWVVPPVLTSGSSFSPWRRMFSEAWPPSSCESAWNTLCRGWRGSLYFTSGFTIPGGAIVSLALVTGPVNTIQWLLHFFINCAQLIFFLLSWQWSESNHSCDFCISLPESFEVPLIYNCTKCMTYRMSKCDLLLHRSS